MPNKKLRIVIADSSLPRRLQIEKSLNKLGYYRILPIQLREELSALNNEFDPVFDVLIANKDMALDAQDDLPAFCQSTHRFNHALLYGGQPVELTTTSFTSIETLHTYVTNVPSDEFIEYFMLRLSSPSPLKCLKVLDGIKSPQQSNNRLFAMESSDIETPEYQ